jgi:hypothetical protein
MTKLSGLLTPNPNDETFPFSVDHLEMITKLTEFGIKKCEYAPRKRGEDGDGKDYASHGDVFICDLLTDLENVIVQQELNELAVKHVLEDLAEAIGAEVEGGHEGVDGAIKRSIHLVAHAAFEMGVGYAATYELY